MTQPAIALIGLGPRGLSTLERLLAQANALAAHPEQLTLHLIDDAPHGGGPIWDIGQPKVLCMNTFAHGMTLFSEPGATVTAPVVEGPTIYEWIRLLIGDSTNIKPEKLNYIENHPLEQEVFERFSITELQEFRPESYLPRALYGYYLRWYFHSLLRDVPAWIEVREHHARAVNYQDHQVELSTGEQIPVNAVLAVTGWQEQGLTRQEEWITQTMAENPELRWIRANNPLQQNVDSLKPGEKVLVRGLGMGFFDVAILCTEGRGGQFVEDATKPGGLRYEATGQEPIFYASSRRGYPFLPQSDDRGLPQPAALPRLKQVVAELAGRTGRASIDYDQEVWPAVLRDTYQAYVETLARVEPEALRSPLAEIIAALDAAHIDASAVFNGITAVDQVLEQHTHRRFSLLRWIHLLPQAFDNPAELDAYLVARMVEDLREAELGPDSPVRAALWTLGCARKPTQLLGAEGRYTIESRHHMFDKAIALAQMACSGPPIFRIRQLLALVDAGLIHFVGGYPLLGTAPGEWTMSSQSSGGKRFHGTTLLDAWVHKTDTRRNSPDPFARAISARAVPFMDITHDGVEIATPSPDQDPETRQLRTSLRDAEPVHLVGIPGHAQYPDTTISPPLPGTDSWFIQETDKAAVSALRVALS